MPYPGRLKFFEVEYPVIALENYVKIRCNFTHNIHKLDMDCHIGTKNSKIVKYLINKRKLSFDTCLLS